MIYLKEGFIPLNFAYNDEIVQEGNGKYQLSFKFPTNNPLWESLTEETLLLADDLHGEQEFIIFEVERHHGYITVYANQVATLLNNYSISELSVNNASGDRVMRSLVSSIIRSHNFTFSSDIAATHSINLKNVTVATALFKDMHSILGQWGGDLIRDKYDIKLLSNGGDNKEALFMYKKNLKTYQQKKSTKDLRTRIHFTKTINSQKEGEADKVIAVTLDSVLINKYKNIYEGNLEVNDQDVVDEAGLLKYAKQYYRDTLCDVIEESIEINVVGKPDVPVKIFDTVTIFHEKFNLDVKKKITKYTFSPMGKKLKTIGFGKIQQGLGTVLSNMIDEAVTEKVETKVDAFKIQKNLADLLKKDRTAIEEKMKTLEEQSKAGVEVKKALFEKDGTVPPVTRTKILDAVEADIARLKTIITEAELIKAIQAHLDFAEIKTALIDKAFITQILSDETFRQEFEAGEVTTQNIFTKMRDSIQSSIKKEFITKEETKKIVNDLTIGADGIRQITQEETNKIIDNRKNELKGKDGKIPAFNQLIGSHFPSLDSVLSVNNTPLNLNLNDYNGHNSVEVNDKSTKGELKGFAIPTSIRESVVGKHILMRIPIYIFPDSAHTSIKLALFPLAYDAGFDLADIEKGKWVIKEFKFPFTKSGAWPFKSFIFGTTGGHFKIAEPYIAVDDTLTDKWLPAIEDMKANNLTASARIEGSYLNSELSNCAVYLDIFNNGNLIRESSPENKLKIEIKRLIASGYTSIGEVTLDNNGRVKNINIPNGKKDGKPIEIIFEVSYGGNRVVASARLDNTVEVELVNNTINKFKTFESTLDKFESTIKEIDKKKFKMAYNIENLCSETASEKKGNDLYFNTKRPLEANKYYYILAYLKNVPDGRLARIYYAENNGDNKSITNGLNIWKVKYSSQQTRVNIFSQGSDTTVKNVEIYEVPETPSPEEDVLESVEIKSAFFNLKFKRKIKPNEILKLTFNISGSPTINHGYYCEVSPRLLSKKPLVEGENIFEFKLYAESNEVQFIHENFEFQPNIVKSNFKCVKITFDKGYSNEYNISEMETIVRQTKSEIEHAVRKDNFGTVLTQNAEYLRLAWNNISKFIQFENGAMSFYEGGQINNNKLVARLNDSGYQMWRDGYYLGAIGTNSYKEDISKKGIQFDLNYDGWFMGWAYQPHKNANYYNWKWVYSSGNFASYKADTLNAGCDIDLHGYKIRNGYINPTEFRVEGGVTTDSYDFMLADGRSLTIRFKNGFALR